MNNDGIRVRFGLHQDGAEWSDRPSSLGEFRAGPLGLLSFLEGRLGLRGVETHQAIRINQYLRRVERLDAPDAWFHDSFLADSWSTARQLLAWRDELVESGWGGAALQSSSPRLRAISALEQIDEPLASGFADRLLNVMVHLSRLAPETIQSITLEEPMNCLPRGWWKLFGNLFQRGVAVRGVEANLPPLPADGEALTVLSFLKRALAKQFFAESFAPAGETPPRAEDEDETFRMSPGDESLLLVEADTEWDAAESLARWLSSRPDANDDITLILPQPSAALDQAMAAHGLPRPGGGAASPWRAHLQILPLVCANAWSPADLGTLVELLALPVSPIPSYARRILLDALAREPGIGGKAWNAALEKIRARFLEFGAEKGKSEADADRFVEKLEWMLVGDRHHVLEGIPESSLKARCQWVVESLGPRVSDEPILAEALRQAQDLMAIAEGRGRVSRVALERMLDSVVGLGGAASGTVREVSPWRVASHPGAVAYPSGTVVWWDFSGADSLASTYWSAEERNDLLRHGVMMDEPGALRRRESFAWNNALAKAGERVLLFRSKNVRGEEAERHPFWDAIAAAIERSNVAASADMLVRKPGELSRDGVWSLAGRGCAAVVAEKTTVPVGRGVHNVPAGIVHAPAKTSYSDMKDLIECPMKWVLGKHAGVYASDLFSLPSEAQCMGNVCHAIARELFADSTKKWRPDEAGKEAERLYDELVGSMYMDLLAEGREVDRAREKERVGDAFHALVQTMEKHGLTPEATEAELTWPLGASELRGFADLVCGDAKGGNFIIDFKWTGNPNRYRDEVLESRAMQLATYAWLLRETRPGAEVGAGYYLLRQGRLHSDSELFGRERLAAGNSLKTIFALAENAWRSELRKLADGEILARGVSEQCARAREGLKENEHVDSLKNEAAEKDMLYRQPSCLFCEYKILCGIGSVMECTDGGAEGEQ